MITFFRAPIKNIIPEAQVSILQIYKYITGGYAKLATERLRSMSDPATARRYKGEMLDYVTFSGCFSTRRTGDLIEHSGFLCFDIDKIESEKRLQEIKSLLINDEELHTVLCFRSPSGNGLKWVVEVPDRYWLGVSHTDDLSHTDDNWHTDITECTEFDFSLCSKSFINEFSAGAATASSVSSVGSVREKENSVRKKNNSVRDKNNSVREGKNDVIVKNHRVLYERIRGYLFEQYGIETDHTSDIARPCYLCHDADAYYDPPTFKDNPASRFLKITDNRVQSTDYRLQITDINQQTVDCRPSTVDFRQNNYENDIEKIVQNIEHRRLDITNDYHNWMLVAMALAGTYGSAGEQYFHRISQFHPKYNHTEAHRMYQSCVRNTHGAVGIGTIVYLIHNS